LNAKKSALLSWGTLILFLISMGSSRAPASAPSVRINAGATSSFEEANGSTWLPDQSFTGGATYANSNPIAGTSYPEVYGTERYGRAHSSFGYKVHLANGNYNVSLDFAETYVSGPGRRIFSVSINGTQVLTNFDIYAAAGGMNIAVQKIFPVTVTDGTLRVNFIPGFVENPKINGIEVVQSSGSGSGGSRALEITMSQVPSGILSKSYSATLSASGGTTPYPWSLSSGSLPIGLTLSSAGTISGTPTSAGSFPFTVQVTDAASRSASANLSINIANPVPSVVITSPATGATLSGTVTVSGTASDSVSLASVQVSVDHGASSKCLWNL
jgi:large repetitive protein